MSLLLSEPPIVHRDVKRVLLLLKTKVSPYMKYKKNKKNLNKNHGRALLPTASMIAAASLANIAPAAVLTPSDGQPGGGLFGGGGDGFGRSVSSSGNGALVASPYHAFAETGSPSIVSGAVYYYDNAGIGGDETHKLVASDRKDSDFFGYSISASGTNALVGAVYSGGNFGAAYYYATIDDTSSPLSTWDGNRYIRTQSAKLVASDGYYQDMFGHGTSLSNVIALVGASNHDYAEQGSVALTNSGAAYCYFNLPNDGSVATEDIKIIASDRVANGLFGRTVSMSGKNALVGAIGQNGFNGQTGTGAAYYYDYVIDTDLNNPLVSKDGSRFLRTENVKLVSSDGQSGHSFGASISLSDGNALVGASQADGLGSGTGAAYYYADAGNVLLAQNTGSQYVRTETIKLVNSDMQPSSVVFAHAVSLSNGNALVGSAYSGIQVSNFTSYGKVYYYADVGDIGLAVQVNNQYTRTETLKLHASSLPEKGCNFGDSVSMDGDRFVIGGGTDNATTNKVWAGDIRAFTKLDAGNVSLATGGISFESRTDWIIGEHTSNNHVTLNGPSAGYLSYDGDVAKMDGNNVRIGMFPGSNNNTLRVEGNVSTTGSILVGAVGNSGNTLHIAPTGYIRAVNGGTVVFSEGNKVVFDLTQGGGRSMLIEASNVLFAGTLELAAGDGFAPAAGNSYKLFDFTTAVGAFSSIVDNTGLGPDMQWDFTQLYTDGRVFIAAVPEPATWGVLGGVALLGLAVVRRRRRG